MARRRNQRFTAQAASLINNLADQPVTPVLPVPVDESLNTKSGIIEAKVTKADMINILTVSIMQNLEEEKRVVQAKLTSNVNAYSRASLDAYQAGLKVLRKHCEKRFKDRMDIENPEQFWNNLSNSSPHHLRVFENDGKPVRLQIDIQIQMESIVQTKLPMPDGEASISDSEKTGRVNVTMSWESLSMTKIQDERKLINEELREINERIGKAHDQKYVRAQLDLATIASTDGGAQAAANVQKLANKLSQTMFAKRPSVPELPSS